MNSLYFCTILVVYIEGLQVSPYYLILLSYFSSITSHLGTFQVYIPRGIFLGGPRNIHNNVLCGIMWALFAQEQGIWQYMIDNMFVVKSILIKCQFNIEIYQCFFYILLLHLILYYKAHAVWYFWEIDISQNQYP
jgi:hypothetical protein